MPVGRRGLPFSSAAIDSGVAQRNTPEFPPDTRNFHSTTSSRLVRRFFVRITPIGCPVQWIMPLVQDQVSGAQFTLTKSSLVRSRQPIPVPSMNAFGALFVGSAKTENVSAARSARRSLVIGG